MTEVDTEKSENRSLETDDETAKNVINPGKPNESIKEKEDSEG